MFTLDQQYADDIGWLSTSKSILNYIEEQPKTDIQDRNLKINTAKTERLTVSKVGNDDWQKCKIFRLLFRHR